MPGDLWGTAAAADGFPAGDEVRVNAKLPPSQTQHVLKVLAKFFLGGDMLFLGQLPLALMGMVLARDGGAFWELYRNEQVVRLEPHLISPPLFT